MDGRAFWLIGRLTDPEPYNAPFWRSDELAIPTLAPPTVFSAVSDGPELHATAKTTAAPINARLIIVPSLSSLS